MSVFLHFLNRETYRAVNISYPIQRIYGVIRVLTIAHISPLYSNYSNVMEGGFLDAHAPSPIVKSLVASNQLLIAGERPSLKEFVASRSEMYAFDRDRYPMYFTPTPVPFDVPPAYIRQTSVTDHLSQEIASLASGEKGPKEVGLAGTDVKIAARIGSRLGAIVVARGTKAVTRSLFEEALESEVYSSVTSRLISGLYVSRYLQDLKAVLATGIPELAAFDHLAPDTSVFLDVQVNYGLLRRTGFGSFLAAPTSGSDDLVVMLRGSDRQAGFSDLLHLICRTFDACFNSNCGDARRAEVRRLLSSTGYEAQELGVTTNLYETACTHAGILLTRLRRGSHLFAERYETVLANQKMKTVLIVTATKVETQALAEAIGSETGATPTIVSKTAYIAQDFGHLEGVRVVQVQCEAGSVGAASSLAVTTDAIRDFCPAAVIVTGIAFGLKPDKQTLGDVLVSKMVHLYEKAKQKDGQTLARGERIEASPKLLSVFRAAEAQGIHDRVHFGTVLSGEKLVDDKAFVDKLLTAEPEAIGGEMEGAGVVSAATRAKIDWILVKSIVDWAHNKDRNNDEAHQLRVARQAVSFVVGTLRAVGL